MFSMKQRVNPWLKASRLPAHCRLGSEQRRRGGACSACTHPQEFEVGQAITQLINTAALKRNGVCPYQVVASHLVAGLTLRPNVARARSAGRARVDPVREVKGALGRIKTVIRATGLTSDDIEAIALSNHGDWWQALDAVLSAERALGKALALFRSQIPELVRHGRGTCLLHASMHEGSLHRRMRACRRRSGCETKSAATNMVMIGFIATYFETFRV